MNLYLDDNRAGRDLIGLLQQAGHRIVRPASVNLLGAPDTRHLHYAIRNLLVVLTADRQDFWDLHDLLMIAGGSHPGILVVRYDNDSKRDMRAKHVVAALRRLENSGMSLLNQVVVLNQWR